MIGVSLFLHRVTRLGYTNFSGERDLSLGSAVRWQVAGRSAAGRARRVPELGSGSGLGLPSGLSCLVLVLDVLMLCYAVLCSAVS